MLFRSEYVVGVSDELSVNVWKMPDLSGNVVVRPDGTITLPLIGELRAQGKSPTRIMKEIKGKLAAFVKDDQAVVTVVVVGDGHRRGAVGRLAPHPSMGRATRPPSTEPSLLRSPAGGPVTARPR